MFGGAGGGGGNSVIGGALAGGGGAAGTVEVVAGAADAASYCGSSPGIQPMNTFRLFFSSPVGRSPMPEPSPHTLLLTVSKVKTRLPTRLITVAWCSHFIHCLRPSGWVRVIGSPSTTWYVQ